MIANKKVLVLNKSWRAIAVVTLDKALNKVFSTYVDGTPKAKIIDPVNDFAMCTWEDWSKIKPADGEQGIRTVNAIFRVPEVIQFTRYDKMPAQKVHYNRRTIFKRDNFKCQYCGDRKNSSELSLDHVKPRCQGGITSWENIVVACTECNSKKAGRTPDQAGMKLLRQPFKPKSNIVVEDIRVKSWETFLGESYWLTELENDIF
jgi:5-methylcytosine-specific restriction endonuclease McrA